MASDNPGSDLEWLSDYVVIMLRSPTWALPVSQFMDDHCILFDEDLEESPLEHTRCHEEFKQLICNNFALHLAEVSVTEEQFERFCDCGLSENTQLHRVLAEQLIAVEDFLTFRAMMSKHNADIYREVANLEVDGDETFDSTLGVTGMANAVVHHSVAEGLAAASDEWQLYDSQLFATGTVRFEHENPGMQEAHARCEEAELEYAIAISLQIEEERLRHIAAGEEPESLVPREESVADVLASALQSDHPPAIPQLPGGAGFISAPMVPLPPRPTGIVSAAALPRMVQVEPFKPRAWGFTSAPLMPLPPPIPSSEEAVTSDEVVAASVLTPAVPRLPGTAGFLSSPLCVVPPRPKIPVGISAATAAIADEPAEQAPPAPPAPPQFAEHAVASATAAELDGLSTNLQLWRARAEKAMEPLTPNLRQTRSRGCTWNARTEPEIPPVRHVPTEEERQQRAEHLKQLRDRLIEKRQRDRERQLAELNPHLTCATSASAAGVDEAARSRHLLAELTPGAVVAGDSQPPTQDLENKAERMRQALTLQLRQSLMRSMVSDAGVLDNQLSQLESMRWR
eukprot:TRINITY_DN64542_c0_g1_i1.p1 TRINITY_DN64542_c0_g1~~TRINITY_DN64542_c0_g1_i1.p1  ORF type:complete len:598 (+),score=110.27 TRINITY_DN64542_c0_g1_i1:90-1796(+)